MRESSAAVKHPALTATGIAWSRHDSAMMLVSLIWGANFSISKYALRYIPPLTTAAVRFTAGSVLLYLVAMRLAPGGRPTGRKLWHLAALGVLGNTIYQMAFMTGLSRTSATNASLLMAAIPMSVALIGVALGIERPTRPVWWGIVIGTIGVVLVVGAKGVHVAGATWNGDALVLFAVFCWSLFTVGVRRAGAGTHPIWVTTIATIAGAPGLVLAALPSIGSVPWLSFGPLVWASLAYTVLFALVLAYALWSESIQGIGGSRVALYSCVIPVVAIGFAWMLLGEQPRWVQLPGGLLVIIGVLVGQRRTPDPIPAE